MRFKYIKYQPKYRKENMTEGKFYKVLNSVESHKFGYFSVINDMGERVTIRLNW